MPQPLHAVPLCSTLAGPRKWVRCPDSDHNSKNAQFEAATQGTVLGGVIRLVAGWNPKSKTFSRTFQAYQITEGGPELGFAHMAHRNTTQKMVGNAGQVISDIAKLAPDLAAAAWGPEEAVKLTSESYANSILDSERGGHKSQNDWFLAGWNWVSQQPDGQRVYVQRWFQDIAAPAINWAASAGVQDAKTVAAAIRMRNSSGTQLGKLKDAVSRLGEEQGREYALAEYSHPDRTEAINTWPEFQGASTPWPNPSDLGYQAAPGPSGRGRTVISNGGPAGSYIPVSLPAPGWMPSQVSKMGTGMKVALAIGGVAAVGGLAYLGYRLTTKKKGKKRKKRR